MNIKRTGFWDAPSHYTHIEALAWAAGHNQAADKPYAVIKIQGARLSYTNPRPPTRKAECGDLGFLGSNVRHDWWVNSPLSPGYRAGGHDNHPRNIRALITQYLSSGGFFNPELMDPQTGRDLLMEAREVIAELECEKQPARIGPWRPITEHPTESGGYWIWQPGTRPNRDWIGHWAYRADLGRWGSYGDYSPIRGSYWMPLPKPPVTSF